MRHGLIVAVGKSGNPNVMDGVHPDLVVGPGTEVIAGEHLIATPGGVDAHIHMIAPQQVYHALSNGITTMIGGGTGPADGTNATTCTPGPWNIARMLEAAEPLPVNWGLLGKGNASDPGSRWRSRSLPGSAGSSSTRTGAPRRRPSTAAWPWPTGSTCRWRFTPTR